MTERVSQEVDLLKQRFPDLQFVEAGPWIRIPRYPLPEGWNRTETDVAFPIPVSYPSAPPYGIYVPAGLLYKGQKPNNYSEPAGNKPPFEGEWAAFSWAPEDGEWRPTGNPASGPNLVRWVLGFKQRFIQGV